MKVFFEKIERIEIVQYDGIVYNLMTGDEEFVAENVVVHNCPHLWDTRPDTLPREQCQLLWMG